MMSSIAPIYWGDLNNLERIFNKKVDKMRADPFKMFENLMLYINVVDIENYALNDFIHLLERSLVEIVGKVLI